MSGGITWLAKMIVCHPIMYVCIYLFIYFSKIIKYILSKIIKYIYKVLEIWIFICKGMETDNR